MNLNDYRKNDNKSKLHAEARGGRFSLGGTRNYRALKEEDTIEEASATPSNSINTSNIIHDKSETMENREFVTSIPVELIDPYSLQARSDFSLDELKELTQSIKENDLINPIHLIKKEDGRYQVIAGERRLRAHKELGLKEIKAIVGIEDKKTLLKSIIDNYQRSDLNILEKGRAFHFLIKEGICKDVDDVALKMGGISKKVIYECISLWKNTPEKMRDELIKDKELTRATLRSKVKDGFSNKQASSDDILQITVRFSKKGSSVVINKETSLSKEEKEEIKELFGRQLDKI